MTLPELFKADVRIERDIHYVAEEAHARHRLDLYAPPDAHDLPVLLYFYGGGWRSGDKRLFEHLGRSMALKGMVVVTVNYRLTPEVSAPAHVEDCARAIAWCSREIGRHGGDPRRLFISGHSAGAHLAALVTVDPSYLQAVEVAADSVRGVIMISGVGDLADHVDATVFTSREHVEQAFGSSREELERHSPISHLRAGLPPFLVIVAEDDPPGLREQGREFADALRDHDVEVFFISVKGRDHFSIVRRFGSSDDPTAGAMAEFIRHHDGAGTDHQLS